MSLILNSTTITAVNLNGTSVQSMQLNGTVVFTAAATVTATYATSNGSRWNLNGTDAGVNNVGDNFYTAGVTLNAYRDANAKSVGTAQIGGVIGVWDGTYWKPQGDTTKVLSGDFKVSVTATDIGGVSGNGLIYTKSSSPFDANYAMDSHFGVTAPISHCFTANKQMNNTNILATRKMFLPTWSETKLTTTSASQACGGTGNIGGAGVSSVHGYTWIATGHTSGGYVFICDGATGFTTPYLYTLQYVVGVR